MKRWTGKGKQIDVRQKLKKRGRKRHRDTESDRES
jgi:hypothetical protein